MAQAHRPSGFKRAPAAAGPTCIGEDGEPGTLSKMTIQSHGRKLDIRFESLGLVIVLEANKELWREHVGSAGGADATTACSHDGWGVLIAGHDRHGDDVFDLFTGKKLGPGDVRAYAPDLSFALAPPQFWWGSQCYRWSRTFRIPTDGTKRPYALATPPVPSEWTCDGMPDGGARRPEADPPTVAISPDSKRYAIASPHELAVYRASDDALVARYLRPPYAGHERTEDITRLAFSAAGDGLVMSRDAYSDEDDRYVPAASHWFTIEAK